jgi:hypothetical protein
MHYSQEALKANRHLRQEGQQVRFAMRLSQMLVGAVVLTACSGAPSAPAPAPTGPRSALANITLPAGSIGHKQPEGVGEVWLVTTPYDFTVNSLRQQLPVGGDYEGLRWCKQEVNDTPGTQLWAWGDGKSSLEVEVLNSGTVEITRGMSESINEPAC